MLPAFLFLQNLNFLQTLRISRSHPSHSLRIVAGRSGKFQGKPSLHNLGAGNLSNSAMPQIRLSRRDPSSTPLPYTASPLLLFCRDISLFLRYIWAIPGILLPLNLGQTTPLDELYPSLGGLVSFSVQLALTIAQIAFLISIPVLLLLLLPTAWIIAYVFAGFALNYLICLKLLNGTERVLVSQVPVSSPSDHERECWFFINGVANRQVEIANILYSFICLTLVVNTGSRIISIN